MLPAAVLHPDSLHPDSLHGDQVCDGGYYFVSPNTSRGRGVGDSSNVLVSVCLFEALYTDGRVKMFG